MARATRRVERPTDQQLREIDFDGERVLVIFGLERRAVEEFPPRQGYREVQVDRFATAIEPDGGFEDRQDLRR
jgi:hypothetical protein